MTQLPSQGWRENLTQGDAHPLQDAARAFWDTKLELKDIGTLTVQEFFNRPDCAEFAYSVFSDRMPNSYNGYLFDHDLPNSDVAGCDMIHAFVCFMIAIERLADRPEYHYFQDQFSEVFRPGCYDAWKKALNDPQAYLQQQQALVDTHGLFPGERTGFLPGLESAMQGGIMHQKGLSGPDGKPHRPGDIVRMEQIGMPVIHAMQSAYQAHLEKFFTGKSIT